MKLSNNSMSDAKCKMKGDQKHCLDDKVDDFHDAKQFSANDCKNNRVAFLQSAGLDAPPTIGSLAPRIEVRSEENDYLAGFEKSVPTDKIKARQIFELASLRREDAAIVRRENGIDDKHNDKLVARDTKEFRKWARLDQQSTFGPIAEDHQSIDRAGQDEMEAGSAANPPFFGFTDRLPSMTSLQPNRRLSNQWVVDEVASVVTELTDHSALTIPMRNILANSSDRRGGDRTIVTTSTMITEEVVNSLAINQMRASIASTPTQDVAKASNSHRKIRRFFCRLLSPCTVMDYRGQIISNEDDGICSEPDGLSNEGDGVRSEFSGRRCERCKAQKTHEAEKYGPFGVLSRMKARTVEGQVYKGVCLFCYNVHALRDTLNDPYIPLDLVRHDSNTNSTIRLLQDMSDKTYDSMFTIQGRIPRDHEIASKRRQLQALSSIFLVAFVTVCIGIGILLSKSPALWVSPPPTTVPSSSPTTQFPTAVPTSSEWRLVASITKDDAESFGYQVGLASNGNILAVTAPRYEGNRGRLDVYMYGEGGWETIDSPIIGDMTGDELGLAMDLSGDGSVVAVGMPGNDAGIVKVYNIDIVTGLSQKGQPIFGPTPLSQFGYSVALNFDGTRLFVGAPQFGWVLDDINGLVRAYDFDGTTWVQVGSDIHGCNPGSRFGNSVSTDASGDRVGVGAPLDSEKWQEAGGMFTYDLVDNDWNKSASLRGYQTGSQLGKQVSMDCSGAFATSSGHDHIYERFPNAGLVRVWEMMEDTPAFETMPDGLVYNDPISGTYKSAYFGHDALDLDCSGFESGNLIMIASSKNQRGQAGPTLVVDIHDFTAEYDTTEFFGYELGDTKWLGQAPSVSIAGQALRLAIGYESIRSSGFSRSEIHIYDRMFV